jgi:N-acetylglucosaminyldiphosphoundecaprenol N-acetyl-beta-D-mannosaminyltransferase
MSVRVSFLGLSIDEMTSPEAVRTIRNMWHAGAKNRVFFVNAHCLNVAASNEEYRESLGMAELVLADGSGVLLASRLLDLPIQHNLNGTDLVPLLCAVAAEEQRSVFLLGAQPGVAERAAKKLCARFPNLRIAGIQHGFFDPSENAALVEHINAARPDMLIVALGVPLQELWLTRHFAQLDVPVCLAVGALFDFLSDSVPRAPQLLRRWGIEWLYRLYREPRRLWRRYIVGNVTFLARVCAVRFLGMEPIRPPLSARGTIPAGVTLAGVAAAAHTEVAHVLADAGMPAR